MGKQPRGRRRRRRRRRIKNLVATRAALGQSMDGARRCDTSMSATWEMVASPVGASGGEPLPEDPTSRACMCCDLVSLATVLYEVE
jgi:hypothetical protein